MKYWEGATAIHQMQSKWMDVGMEMAAFHLTSSRFDTVKPPTFGENIEEEKSYLMKKRSRGEKKSMKDMATDLEHIYPSFYTRLRLKFGLSTRKKPKLSDIPSSENHNSKGINKDNTSMISPTNGFFRERGEAKCLQLSPFLLEGSHLLSLLSAVALGSLRSCDFEDVELAFDEYIPGHPWPAVDPDALRREVREEYEEASRVMTAIKFLLGLTKDEKHRKLYFAARPLKVLGGVSEAECESLRKARGSFAKTALCTMWLQAFISRECVAGSTGTAAPPIISRLYQYTSDGMLGYNQARKIASIPFPFAHYQLTLIFLAVLVGIIPVMTLSYVNNKYFGAVLNFLIVMIFSGLHEVSRELEAPFTNAPNDLPLNTFQALFNEGLLTMHSGYNPDSYWDLKAGSKLDFSPKVKL